jgi:hypothetical protein
MDHQSVASARGFFSFLRHGGDWAYSPREGPTKRYFEVSDYCGGWRTFDLVATCVGSTLFFSHHNNRNHGYFSSILGACLGLRVRMVFTPIDFRNSVMVKTIKQEHQKDNGKPDNLAYVLTALGKRK